MKQGTFICIGLFTGIIVSGCIDDNSGARTSINPKLSTVMAVDENVALKNTYATNSGKASGLAQRLDNEPELACQMAYRTTAEVVKAQADSRLPSEHPRIELTPEHIFMKDCSLLPRKVQKCLVDQYAFKHIGSCREARMAYDNTVNNTHNE